LQESKKTGSNRWLVELGSHPLLDPLMFA